MNGIRSLAYATELIFPHFTGSISDHGDFLCIETPQNPDYMWGNFLLFKSPPQEGCYTSWIESYRAQFPRQRWFASFGWDSVDQKKANYQEFIQNGFKLEQATVLAAQSIQPPPNLRSDIKVIPIADLAEWNFVTDRHIEYLCSGPHKEEQADFERLRFIDYRSICEKGHGNWFVAKAGGRIVGDMGVFFFNEKARFQEVLTYPEFRRSGVCRALCYGASRYSLDKFSVDTIVTLTDDADALSAYQSIGFRKTVTSEGLRWYDLNLRPSK